MLRAYPDTCVGTDSHTTMVNGLGVLGWGVGGIEAEAAMLGQPVSMLDPARRRLQARPASIPAGATATDVVLTITEMLRKHGVVGKFVEFYGEGVAARAAGQPRHHRQHVARSSAPPPRCSRSTTSPLDYLRLTGRSEENVALVEAYAKEQGLWHDPAARDRASPSTSSWTSSTVVPSIAGPKRPQDRIRADRCQGAVPQGHPATTPAIRRRQRGRVAGRVVPGSDAPSSRTPARTPRRDAATRHLRR